MKRIIVCIIAAVMAVSLAGCSGENDVTNTKNTEASQGISSEEKAAHGKNTEANLVDQTELPETEVETEPPKGSELGLTEQQLNSFSMLYYLAITAEEIRTSKDNRLMLEDIYTSLLNDINPGAIDDITQDHLQNLRNIIGSYIDISVK